MFNRVVVIVSIAVGLAACNSKKIKNIDTNLENAASMREEQIGKNSDGLYVVQKKENLVDHLSDLQKEVYTMEESIYGNRKFGNKGLYGVLEDCRIKSRAQKVGKNEMVEKLPRTILSLEESKISKKLGVDEKGTLVKLSEEDLQTRIDRFEKYKQTYQDQQEWFDTEIKACKVSLTKEK